MATAKIWSNVQVAMQSALATAKTISAITKANPGVATSTAHGYSNGTYLLHDVTGMTEIDGRVFRTAGVATDTWQLEGENTTSYGTFTAGTAQAITFGTTLGTVKGLSASGGDYNFIDTTTIHDKVATQIPGLASPISYSFENIWDVSDAGLVALKTASDTKAQRAFKFTFADGQIMVFNGYVGATLLPGGSAQDLVTTSVVITMFGAPTYYSS